MTQATLYSSNGFEVTHSQVRFGNHSVFVRQISSVELTSNLPMALRLFKVSLMTLALCAAIVLPLYAIGWGPGGLGAGFAVVALLALWIVGPLSALMAVGTGIMAAYLKWMRRGGYFLLVTGSDRRVSQIGVSSLDAGRALKQAIEQAVAMQN